MMTDLNQQNGRGATTRARLTDFFKQRSRASYVALLGSAAVLGAGAYLSGNSGMVTGFLSAGSKASQASFDRELERVQDLAPAVDAGGSKGDAAAAEIIDLATRIRLIGRQANLPELDNAVAKAGLALLKDGVGANALAHREQARFALTLINMPGAKVNLAYELLQSSKSRDETFYLLGITRAGLRGLPAERRDAVRAGMATILARSSLPHATDAAFLQCADIENPSARAIALHDVALLRIQVASQGSSPGVGSALPPARSDAALVHAAHGEALKANVLPATLLALSVQDVALRDRVLQFVVQEGANKTNRWQLLPAIFGISSQSDRDETSLAFVYRATNDGHGAEARVVSDAMVDPGLRVVARSVIAENLAGLGYGAQVDEVLPTREQVEGLIGGSRQLAASYSAAALATLGRTEPAGEMLALVKTPNRISTRAATELAENLSRTSGKAEEIKALLRYADPGEQPNIAARAAIASARAGNVPAAMRYVDSIESVGVRVKAAALFAIEVRLPDEWLQSYRSQADALRPSLGDRSGLLAAFAAARGQTDDAARLLASSRDDQLGARVSNELARQFVAQGRVRDLRAIPLVGSGDRQRSKDALLRAAALSLADRGQFDRAAYVAREMADYKPRVATMRAIAMGAARETDTHKALDGTLQAAPEFDPASRLDAPLIRRRSFNIYDPGGAKVGSAIPTLPNASIHTASSVNEKIPAARREEEPSFSVVPLANNGYNKKFLTARSAFEDIVPGGPTIVMRAQGTSYPVYLHLDRGVVELPWLYNKLIEQGYPDLIERKGRVYTLRVPLFVANSAKLVLSEASVDQFRLSVNRAAYVVSAGQVFFSGVHVLSWDEKTNSAPVITEENKHDFRPFYIAWSNSETFAARSKFEALGYSSGKAYGFSFSNGPLALMSVARVVKEPRGVIVDSTFEHMLYGFYSWEAADVALVGNEYRNNLTYGIDPHDWSKRLLVAYNTAYGSQKKHGIIGSRHVEDSWFFGNMTFDNHGSGLMMDRYSGRNVLYANYSFDNHGSGVAIYESPCNIVSSNQVFRNHGNGVFVRNSWDVGVFNNTISGNHKLGVNAFTVKFVTKPGAPARNLELDPYERFATMSVARNTLSHNAGGGIGALGVGATQLRANTLIGNPKRSYIGDFRAVEFDIARQSDQGILIGGSCPKPKIAYVCNFANQGYLTPHLMAAASATPIFRSCPSDTTVNAKTAQKDALVRVGITDEEKHDDEDDGARAVTLADRSRRMAGALK